MLKKEKSQGCETEEEVVKVYVTKFRDDVG